MNHQQEEINKFDNMAPRWWDENGPLKTLHQVNPLRLNFILDNLNKRDLNSVNVLDVGCGGGILAESLAKLGANVTGIDLAIDAITVAKLHSAEQKEQKMQLDYLVTSIEDHTKNSSIKYDVITCMELLEHVPSPESIIYHIRQLLKPGGKIFLSTLNRNMKAYLLAIVGAEYVLNWIPTGIHEYQKFIKPSELASILRNHHFNLQQITGITYSIFKKKFMLSKDIDVNYMVCAQ